MGDITSSSSMLLNNHLRERTGKEADTTSCSKGLFLVLISSQIIFNFAPGLSCPSSWLQYSDLKRKVQVIIIFFNSFRQPLNLPCSSEHSAKRLELRRIQVSRLQRLSCSELGWAISLGNVCSVASQRYKISLGQLKLFIFISDFFFFILLWHFKITSFLEINLCYFQTESGSFISSNL